jgi:regulator of nonsense transcripts 2
MRSQIEADRAEQQRIKNLVLNYDLQDAGDQDGKSVNDDFFLRRNPNLPENYFSSLQFESAAHTDTKALGGDKHQYNVSLNQSPNHAGAKSDRTGANRKMQAGRRLQLSDVDWYETPQSAATANPTSDIYTYKRKNRGGARSSYRVSSAR